VEKVYSKLNYVFLWNHGLFITPRRGGNLLSCEEEKGKMVYVSDMVFNELVDSKPLFPNDVYGPNNHMIVSTMMKLVIY
jgi:hypothetical protein